MLNATGGENTSGEKSRESGSENPSLSDNNNTSNTPVSIPARYPTHKSN